MLTDEKKQDVHVTDLCRHKVIEDLSVRGVQVGTLIVFSDGCKAQYKCSEALWYLSAMLSEPASRSRSTGLPLQGPPRPRL